MFLTRVCFLNGGYCKQLNYFAGRPSWGPGRFHAVFVYLHHPEHGGALLDTGYSPHFFEATRRFPARFYRWLTPVRLDPRQNARAILESQGISPDEVHHLFISHFHGDHIAGLKHFPHATFIYRQATYQSLIQASTWAQVRHAFLARCLPDDFTARGKPIAEASFLPGSPPLGEFRVLDYWGDGSLLLVDLPGHAEGHLGFVLTTARQRWFYIVDATWDVEVMLAGKTLPRLSRRFQHSYPDYVATQDKLRRLAASGGPELLACHCPRTQRHVASASP
jgi:glyoxylase-like metal-dependent hydrolase (beta-lactamase superfamily II)